MVEEKKFMKIVTRRDKEKTEARKMAEKSIVLKSESGRVCAIINLKRESESESRGGLVTEKTGMIKDKYKKKQKESWKAKMAGKNRCVDGGKH